MDYKDCENLDKLSTTPGQHGGGGALATTAPPDREHLRAGVRAVMQLPSEWLAPSTVVMAAAATVVVAMCGGNLEVVYGRCQAGRWQWRWWQRVAATWWW